ncbi:TetR family transcriptional regulator [Actinorhabdospora filicis]|uniref:TetR family transcriptional regulator n=1 Tax=Actinorhabdospora filicis TaxID=1785913 RepID=A0A9W6SKF8_9ACTN|nr:TetR/AcrR family transcriptional regulator [Actinorhabdospora filicis]GLZ77462.1 TetR family transcriptional regulator [Actinorhabdospora filicis]
MTDKKPPVRRSEKSRQAILTAARELVAEYGFAKLTIEAIAARAGVGKQTIYRWWTSKGAVVLDSLIGDTPNGAALPDTGDLATDLREVMRLTAAEMASPEIQASTRAMNVAVQTDPALAEVYRERYLGPALASARDRLASAREAGQVAADADLEVAAEVLFGAIYYRWSLGLGPLDDAYADAVVRLVASGLR